MSRNEAPKSNKVRRMRIFKLKVSFLRRQNSWNWFWIDLAGNTHAQLKGTTCQTPLLLCSFSAETLFSLNKTTSFIYLPRVITLFGVNSESCRRENGEEEGEEASSVWGPNWTSNLPFRPSQMHKTFSSSFIKAKFIELNQIVIHAYSFMAQTTNKTRVSAFKCPFRHQP